VYDHMKSMIWSVDSIAYVCILLGVGSESNFCSGYKALRGIAMPQAKCIYHRARWSNAVLPMQYWFTGRKDMKEHGVNRVFFLKYEGP